MFAILKRFDTLKGNWSLRFFLEAEPCSRSLHLDLWLFSDVEACNYMEIVIASKDTGYERKETYKMHPFRI